MKPDFQAMTRKELLKYILEHRDDDEAFHVYMDIHGSLLQKYTLHRSQLMT